MGIVKFEGSGTRNLGGQCFFLIEQCFFLIHLVHCQSACPVKQRLLNYHAHVRCGYKAHDEILGNELPQTQLGKYTD